MRAWRIKAWGMVMLALAAGCAEGLNLKDDMARWQVVGDTPAASLADPSVRWVAENDPRRAEWEAIKNLAQTVGRVSRHPLDEGETVLVDRPSQRLLDSELLPQTTREAIVYV